jgi:hypothetical protein
MLLAALLLGLAGCLPSHHARSAPGYVEARAARRALAEERRQGLAVPGRGTVRVETAGDGVAPVRLVACLPELAIELPVPAGATGVRGTLVTADRQLAVVNLWYDLDGKHHALVVCDLARGRVTGVHPLGWYDLAQVGVTPGELWISTPGQLLAPSPSAERVPDARSGQPDPLDHVLHRLTGSGRLEATAARITGTSHWLYADQEHGRIYTTSYDMTELQERGGEGVLLTTWPPPSRPRPLDHIWLVAGHGPYRILARGYGRGSDDYSHRVTHTYGFRRDTGTWEWLETEVLNNAWVGI